MAFTDDQKFAAFEMLRVVYDTEFKVLDGPGTLVATEDFSNSSQAAAKTALETHLTDMVGNPEETRVKTYLDRWNNINTKTHSINGSVGQVQGVAYSYAEEMKRLIELTKIYIPFFDFWELARLKSGGGRGDDTMIQTIR